LASCHGSAEVLRGLLDAHDTARAKTALSELVSRRAGASRTLRWRPLPADVRPLIAPARPKGGAGPAGPVGKLWPGVPFVTKHAIAAEVEKEIRARIEPAMKAGAYPGPAHHRRSLTELIVHLACADAGMRAISAPPISAAPGWSAISPGKPSKNGPSGARGGGLVQTVIHPICLHTISGTDREQSQSIACAWCPRYIPATRVDSARFQTR